jgi:aldose 1-epimerase
MEGSEQRFQVIKEKFGACSSYRLTDRITGEYASVLPYLGGAINNLTFKHNNQLISILDCYISPEDAKKNMMTTFKGIKLFPFPNRIKDATFKLNDETYELPMNFPHEHNAIHGLVYDKEFEVLSMEEGDESCVLVLKYSPEKKVPGYPFDYSLEVKYKWIKDTKFECTTKIANHSKNSIPVGDGWHPYFVAGQVSVNDLFIRFPSEKILEVDKRQIPTGNSENYTKFEKLTQLGETVFDNCFQLKHDLKPAETLIFNKKDNFGYKIWQETGDKKYNFIQIYTPPNRKTIAIEPMTCAPDSFNNHIGLILLAPKEKVVVKWGISSIN